MGHPQRAGWDTAEFLLAQANPTTFLLYFALTFAAEADVGAAPIKQDCLLKQGHGSAHRCSISPAPGAAD